MFTLNFLIKLFQPRHWRLAISTTLLLLAVPVALLAQPNISRVEYFIDNDPGLGSATALAIGTSNNHVNLNIPINPTSLAEGIHRLYVRAGSSNGWSLTNSLLFYKPIITTGGSGTVAPNISRVEYFIDNDPGIGNATALSLGTGTNLADQIIPIDPATLTEGVHRLYVRAGSSNGWSLTNSLLFYKPITTSGIGGAAANLKRIEYFIDTDPGLGLATPVAFQNVQNISDHLISVNITGLIAGNHQLNFRALDNDGKWSLVDSLTFNVSVALAPPIIVVNSIGKLTFCANDSIKIGYDATGTYTAGNTFKAYLSNAKGSFANEVEIGTYTRTGSGIITAKLPFHLPDGSGYKLRVKSSTPAITGEASGNLLTIHDRPTAQTITGLSSANGNETWPYTVPTANNSSWNWLVTNGNKTNVGVTNSINIQWASGNAGAIKAAQIKIIETNQFGCIGDTSLQAINIYKLRIGNTISTTTPCPKDSLIITLNTDGLFYATPAANQFIAELSNSSGSFTTVLATANFTSGAITGNNMAAGIFKIGILGNLPNGTNYRIRVRSTNPVFIGDTSLAISIQKPNLGTDIIRSKCAGFPYDLSTEYNTSGLTYSYFTQAFAGVANVAVVETGVYNIVASNANGCKDTAQVTVNNFVKPNLGVDITRSKCLGFTFSLAGVYTDGSLTYTYFTNAFVTVPNAAAVNDGVYNIVATNANGCRDTAQVTVTNYPKPNMGLDIIRSTCVGFGSNLTNIYSDAALAYTYFTQVFATISMPTSVATGLYNIVATNSNGCRDTALVTVNNFIKPHIGADITGFKCAGFKYNLAANYSDAALMYNFYTQGFALVGNSSAVDIGVYNVVATNSDGCRDTAIITVTNFAKPNLGADIARSKCLGFTYDLSTVYNTVGLTYSYFTQAFEVIANAAAIETGVYNIIATSTDGCKDTVQVTVTNFVKPNLGGDITVYHVCAGETTNLVLLYNTSGLTANWNTVNTTAAIPGIYRLIVTNTSGCTDTAFVIVILEVATWTGVVSNDWHTAGNWSTNKIPTLQTHVIIPAGKLNQCNVSTADAEASSIQVRAGSALKLSANRKLLLSQKCTLLPAN